MTPLVSIIIPVYNVEKYLDRCIMSIVNQTYKNLEIVLVDDGSDDKSGNICDDYAKRYENIKVLHQTNQGLSAARNNGVLYSTGDYICFLDSDDYIANNCVEYLFGLIEEFHTDISAGKMVMFYDKTIITPEKKDEIRIVYNRTEALKEICYGYRFDISACGKMYKRELIEKNPYPVGKLYEDLATTYKIVGISNGIAYGSRRVLFYYQREESIIHQRIDQKQLYGLKAAENQLAYMKANCLEAVPAAEYRAAVKILGYLTRLTDGSKESKETYLFLKEKLKSYAANVLHDNYTKKSVKVKIVAALSGYKIMSIAFDYSDRRRKKNHKRI